MPLPLIQATTIYWVLSRNKAHASHKKTGFDYKIYLCTHIQLGAQFEHSSCIFMFLPLDVIFQNISKKLHYTCEQTLQSPKSSC